MKRFKRWAKDFGRGFYHSMKESMIDLAQDFALTLLGIFVKEYIFIPCMEKIDEICERNGWEPSYDLDII